MGKLFRRDTLETENKINDAVTSSDCRVLKYKLCLKSTYSVEVSRIISRCIVIRGVARGKCMRKQVR